VENGQNLMKSGESTSDFASSQGIHTDIVKVYILGQYVRGICDYEGVFQILPHNHKYPTVVAPSLSYYPP